MTKMVAMVIVLMCCMFFGGILFGAFIASFKTGNVYHVIIGMSFGGAIGLFISWLLMTE